MNDTNLPTVEQLLEAADRKVEELVRAIHCLPKPPEGMGDGPDERVANVIFLLQKARGEREMLLRQTELNIRLQVQQRLNALQASILHEENSERIAELEKAREELKR